MANHQKILKEIYPSPERLRALLPQGDARYRMDLSAHSVDCIGYIGSGLLGTVYKVRRNGKEYACKVTSLRYTNPGAPPASVIAEKTLQEIKLIRNLIRDNVHGILPVIEYLPGEQKIREYIKKAQNKPQALIPSDWLILELMPLGLPYTVFMECLFRSGKRLTEAEWAALMLDLVQPVKFMHNKSGIIHRDLKPGNIMLIQLPNGQVRAAIADFNLSKAFAGQTDYGYTKVGTEGYAHPRIIEQEPQRGIRRCDAEKADLYAIAQIGYQLLNAGQTAPCRGYIPAPKNAPSQRVTELLRSMLSSNFQTIPDCDAVIRTLRNMADGVVNRRPAQEHRMPVRAKQQSPQNPYKAHKQQGGEKGHRANRNRRVPRPQLFPADLFNDRFFLFPDIKF